MLRRQPDGVCKQLEAEDPASPFPAPPLLPRPISPADNDFQHILHRTKNEALIDYSMKDIFPPLTKSVSGALAEWVGG